MKRDPGVVHESITLAFRCGFVLAIGTLSGCAYINPYVPLNAGGKTTYTAMPQLTEKISKIDDSLTAVESLRDQTSQLQRKLNLLTFGLGFGAGVAAIYQAHRDAVMALGLGAAASYTGGTLVAPSDQVLLYNAGITGLVCLKANADTLGAVVEAAAMRRREGDLADNYVERQLQPQSCKPGTALAAAVTSAKDAQKEALDALGGAQGSDGTVASSVEKARLSVVKALNDEITSRAPSAQAVLAAAKGAVALGAGFAAARAPVPSPPPADDAGATDAKPAPPPPPPDCTNSADQFRMLESGYKSVKTALGSAMDAIGTLNTVCVLNASPIPELKVTPEQATLAKGSTFTMTVSGGREPYDPTTWEGATPGGLSFAKSGGIIVLIAEPGAAAGTYHLVVRDASLITKTKTIPVTVK